MICDYNEFVDGIKRYVRFSDEQATEVSFNYSDKLLQVVGTDLSLDISNMSGDEVNKLVGDVLLHLSCLSNVYYIKHDVHPATNAILKATLLTAPTNKVLCKMLCLINTLNSIPCVFSAFDFIEGHNINGRVFSAYTDTYNDLFQSAIDFIVDSNAQTIKCGADDNSFSIKAGGELKIFPYKFFP